MNHILILGGTTEASALARLLADAGMRATLSYAGRTQHPRAQPVPVRIGGFGGVDGLIRFIRDAGVTHLVDATHPFAAQMSANAVAAAKQADIAHIALTRPAWAAQRGDRWTHVADMDQAIAAIDGPARRVFLALGRMHATAFAVHPQHHYLLRFVDAPDVPPPLPRHSLVVDCGPFSVAGDRALMEEHRIDLIICKNAGGVGAQAKLIAARELGLPVLMINRPALPERREVHKPEAVLDWILHDATSAIERGV